MSIAVSTSTLPIERIDVYWGKVPVDCRFSYGSPDTFDFLLTCVHSSGHSGWGETLIASIDACCDYASELPGRDARLLDDLFDPDVEVESNLYIEAFSISLYDLVGKVTGKPLYELLGGRLRTGSSRWQRRIIPLMPCIFPKDAEDAAKKAKAFTGQGMKFLKFKLMADPEVDLANLRAIRSAAGTGVLLQGDANEGYSFNDLDDGILAEFKINGLDVIEDPCRSLPKDYARLHKSCHPAIMADEIARHDILLKQTLELKAIDIVNLHPCQQGTISHVLARADMARSFGVPEVVGGTGFIGIGTAAYQHLAGVIGLTGPCGELGGAYDHGQPILCDNLVIKNGCVVLSDTPGHGAEPRMEIISKYLCGKRTYE